MNSLDITTLPHWDLSALYPSLDSPAIKTDLKNLERRAEAFRSAYMGKLATISDAEFGRAIRDYESIDEDLSRIMSFAYLLYAENMTDSKVAPFYQSMREQVVQISTLLIFWGLEINRLDDALLAEKMRHPDVAKYTSWLQDLRLFRNHQLSDDLEKLLHEKHITGHSAWTRLYDETMASLRFPIGGKELTQAEALHLLSDSEASVRQEAAQVIGKVLHANIRIGALVTNTLAKDKEIEDTWRKYSAPAESRHLANKVEKEVVDSLVRAVKDSYPRLSHRYYAMKARWMGGAQLNYWDRNAPLPDVEDRLISWPEARDIVLTAYGRFSPEMKALGQRFFDNAWIDAAPRPGKSPGAFAHPTVPSAHPYLLLNYMGRSRDVMTLAHELGHGVHQLLSAHHGPLMADTPLTLAETASVFGEMLTFRSMLANQTNPIQRKALLASKVEDMLNTVVRQIAFYDFENRVHQERRQGELTSDRLGELWLAVQTESLGPALRFDDTYKAYWSYIQHFIHTPFYVYAYAFGDCLVNSLYAAYEEASKAGQGNDFAKKYLDMLSAAGTKHHRELLAPFGLDASDPSFWNKGLQVIEGYIDELERLEKTA